MKVGRLTSWIFCASIVAALPVMGSTTIAAASPATSTPQATTSHLRPFLAETAQARALAHTHGLKRGTTQAVKFRAMGNVGASGRSVAPLVSAQTETLAGPYLGPAQAQDINAHGGDQDVAPPDTDLAVGPSNIVAVANSTIAVYGRAGGVPTTDDLNTFLSIDTSHSSTDPRIVYDAASARWWLTDTEAPKTCSSLAAPVLVAVSASSNPLPFSSWIVYTLPFETAGTILGDQPGLGMSSNVAAVTWNDYDCNGNWLGSELDILQKSDLEHNTGTHGDSPWTSGNAFAPQPVQSFGAITTQYVVTNESDCAPNVCAQPVAEVDAFTGTPEAQNVAVAVSNPVMTPTLVTVSGNQVYTPPAQQPGTSTTIQTDDDRFLNAVWENGHIWTADNTQCTPPTDTAPRSCLNYLDITASSTGTVSLTTNQINNVGVLGGYLYYPAVSIDFVWECLHCLR